MSGAMPPLSQYWRAQFKIKAQGQLYFYPVDGPDQDSVCPYTKNRTLYCDTSSPWSSSKYATVSSFIIIISVFLTVGETRSSGQNS